MRTRLVPWLAGVALVAHCAPRPDDTARMSRDAALATARSDAAGGPGLTLKGDARLPAPAACVDFTGTYRGRCDGQGGPLDVGMVVAQQDCASVSETTETNGRQVRFEIDAARHTLGAGGYSLSSWDDVAFPQHDHLRVELVDEQQGVVGRFRQQFVADDAGNLTLTLVNMRTVSGVGAGDETVETCELQRATAP